jgi:phosphotriesterase-related protein
MTAAMKGFVRTVAGDVDARRLGLTLPHEHLVSALVSKLEVGGGDGATSCGPLLPFGAPVAAADLEAARRDPYGSRDNVTMSEDLALAELAEFRAEGGAAVVDQTAPDLGRDLAALRRLSAASGLHVIAACGVYQPLLQAEELARRGPAWLAAEWVADLTADPAAGAAPCGVIGEISVSAGLHEAECCALQAAAAAHAATGAPVSLHAVQPEDALAALDLLVAEGVAARRIAVSHADSLVDRGYQRELAARGVFVEFDYFGWHAVTGPDANGEADRERVAAAAALIRGGAARQVLLSQDVVTRTQCTAFGGGGYVHLLRGLAAWFEEDGVGPGELRRVMSENPAAWLAWS